MKATRNLVVCLVGLLVLLFGAGYLSLRQGREPEGSVGTRLGPQSPPPVAPKPRLKEAPQEKDELRRTPSPPREGPRPGGYDETYITIIEEKTEDPVVRAHKKRITPFIETLRKESIDDLVSNLHERDRFLFPGYHSSVMFPEDDLEKIYSNRRFIKLLNLLEQMTQHNAAHRCEAVFAKFLRTYRETLEHLLAKWRDPAATGPPRATLGDRWALSGALILSSRFCTARKVLAQVDAVESLYTEARSKSKDSPSRLGLEPIRERAHCVQKRLRFQVLADAIVRDTTIAYEDKKDVIEYLNALPSTRIPLMPWDAEMTWFDARSVGVGFEASKRVRHFVLYDEPIAAEQLEFIKRRARELTADP